MNAVTLENKQFLTPTNVTPTQKLFTVNTMMQGTVAVSIGSVERTDQLKTENITMTQRLITTQKA